MNDAQFLTRMPPCPGKALGENDRVHCDALTSANEPQAVTCHVALTFTSPCFHTERPRQILGHLAQP